MQGRFPRLQSSISPGRHQLAHGDWSKTIEEALLLAILCPPRPLALAPPGSPHSRPQRPNLLQALHLTLADSALPRSRLSVRPLRQPGLLQARRTAGQHCHALNHPRHLFWQRLLLLQARSKAEPPCQASDKTGDPNKAINERPATQTLSARVPPAATIKGCPWDLISQERKEWDDLSRFWKECDNLSGEDLSLALFDKLKNDSIIHDD